MLQGLGQLLVTDQAIPSIESSLPVHDPPELVTARRQQANPQNPKTDNKQHRPIILIN